MCVSPLRWWKTVVRTGGTPADTSRSSSPHRFSWTTPVRMRAWVETVSLRYDPRSSTSTRTPLRANCSAVAAPATRPPTTTTS
jgi:hypothetical protein